MRTRTRLNIEHENESVELLLDRQDMATAVNDAEAAYGQGSVKYAKVESSTNPVDEMKVGTIWGPKK